MGDRANLGLETPRDKVTFDVTMTKHTRTTRDVYWPRSATRLR